VPHQRRRSNKKRQKDKEKEENKEKKLLIKRQDFRPRLTTYSIAGVRPEVRGGHQEHVPYQLN
jgi:hypothetical protein